MMTYNRGMTNQDITQKNKELFQRLENGDESAKSQIFALNLKLVYKFANKMVNLANKYTVIDLDDLYQIGSIGLIKAINGYSSKKGTTFSTYASYCIRNEILLANKELSKHNDACVLNSFIDDENEIELVETFVGDEPPYEHLQRHDTSDLENMTQNLPESEKRFLALAFGGSLSIEKIEQACNLPAGSYFLFYDDLIRSLKRREKGKRSYSKLFLRDAYFNDTYFFQSKFFQTLTKNERYLLDVVALSNNPIAFMDIETVNINRHNANVRWFRIIDKVHDYFETNKFKTFDNPLDFTKGN